MAAEKPISYKKLITWDEPYKGTFEEFQKTFETIWVFAALEPKARLTELKKAFAIATGKEPEAKKPTDK